MLGEKKLMTFYYILQTQKLSFKRNKNSAFRKRDEILPFETHG